MKSIIQTEKVCYICGSYRNLESHHIFFGNPNRKWSEKYGLKVWLCAYDHRDNKNGVHGQNEDKKKHLWRIGQEAFEKAHSHEEFIQIFGRNFAPELETPPDQEPPGKPPGFTWIQ